MIEDDELKNLFQAESEERLKSLEEALRKLEVDPQDKGAIESAFRDAHTIKGSARMLNIQSIETIAHQLESNLDTIRKGMINLSPKAVQAMFESIYAIQTLVNEAITGKIANVDIPAILRALNFKDLEVKEPVEASSKVPSTPIETSPINVILSQSEPVPEKELPSIPVPVKKEEALSAQKEEKILKRWEKPHAISTVRIDINLISNLMNQAADLTVTKNRMIRLFERIEEILDKWERQYRNYQQPYSFAFYDRRSKEQEKASLQAMGEVYKEVGEHLRSLRNDAYEDIHHLELNISSFVDQVQKLSLLPLSKLFDLFPRMVRDLAQASGKEVDLKIKGEEITVDKKIIEDMKDPLMHLLRNALSHGIEPAEERVKKGKPAKGLIQLIGKQTPTNIFIEVSDDGKGLDIEKIKAVAIQRQIISEKEAADLAPSEIYSLIFLPGFSTASQVSDISGRGVGMDVVKNQVEKLNGSLTIESVPGQGSLFSIQLPISHITTQVILIQADKRIYALPMEMVEACLLISPEEISTVEGYDVVAVQNQPVSLIFLRNLIGAPANTLPTAATTNTQPCVLVKAQRKRVALLVDAILDEQKVVVVPPDPFLSNVQSIMGTTILKTGEICVILNPFDLVKSILKESSSFQNVKKKYETLKMTKTVLLVDDSYTIRLVLKRALEEEGYHVIVAEDGLDGLNKLKENSIDAVVTDAEMPKMDGFTLISKIRSQPIYYTLPIILLTTLSSQEDKKRGMNAGASAYLVKSEYEQQILIETLKKLLHL